MPKPTKKQLAEQAEQARESRIRAALHWTEEAPGPDVQPPPQEKWSELATGHMFNAYTLRVDVACTSRVSHAIGRTDKADSQRPMQLYSTRLLALHALRNAVERECAEKLAKIDQMTEEEERGA